MTKKGRRANFKIYVFEASKQALIGEGIEIMILQEATAGSTYTIEKLQLPVNLERRLETLGLIGGSRISVLRKKRHGAMIVRIRGARFAMGAGITGNILVK